MSVPYLALTVEPENPEYILGDGNCGVNAMAMAMALQFIAEKKSVSDHHWHQWLNSNSLEANSFLRILVRVMQEHNLNITCNNGQQLFENLLQGVRNWAHYQTVMAEALRQWQLEMVVEKLEQDEAYPLLYQASIQTIIRDCITAAYNDLLARSALQEDRSDVFMRNVSYNMSQIFGAELTYRILDVVQHNLAARSQLGENLSADVVKSPQCTRFIAENLTDFAVALAQDGRYHGQDELRQITTAMNVRLIALERPKPQIELAETGLAAQPTIVLGNSGAHWNLFVNHQEMAILRPANEDQAFASPRVALQKVVEMRNADSASTAQVSNVSLASVTQEADLTPVTYETAKAKLTAVNAVAPKVLKRTLSQANFDQATPALIENMQNVLASEKASGLKNLQKQRELQVGFDEIFALKLQQLYDKKPNAAEASLERQAFQETCKHVQTFFKPSKSASEIRKDELRDDQDLLRRGVSVGVC